MSEALNDAGADLAAGARSDWWSSGDPRVNPSARTKTTATTSPIPAHTEAPEYPTHSSAVAPTKSKTKSSSQTSQIALLISSILVIIGSVTAWVTVSVLGHSISASGTDSSISAAISVNGWVTVVLGIVLVAMAALMMASEERSLAAVALGVSATAVGFAVYFVVRILHDISKAHSASGLPVAFRASEHIGWGLVVLLIAAVATTAASVSALRSR